MQWLLGDIDALDRDKLPAAWIVRTGSPFADHVTARVRPSRADLADAALAREDGGAGRLFRRLMVKALAARLFGVDPSTVEIERNGAGALLLPGLPAFASVSGCGDRHLAAVGNSPLGADIEGGDDASALNEWTAREAYLKALGIGLRVAPEAVTLERAGDRITARLHGRECGSVRTLHAPGFTAAVAELAD